MKQLQEFLRNISSLLEVKSIITITIILVFCYKTLIGMEVSSEFVMIASAIVTYYFAKPGQPKKKLEQEDWGDME